MFVVELASLIQSLDDQNRTFITADNSSFTVTGLESNTKYTVQVRAVSTHSAVGDLSGPFSDTYIFKTMIESKLH